MPKSRRITTFLLAVFIPVSFITGYFCVMPGMAAVAAAPLLVNHSGCGESAVGQHYMAPQGPAGQAMAPCCLAKSGRNDTGSLILNEWSPNIGVASRAIFSVDAASAVSSNGLAMADYPVSPPPELLSSVIKIE